jgi:arylsulfatase A-like enzyme
LSHLYLRLKSAILFCVLVILTLVLGCSEPPAAQNDPPQHVILVVFDALRADHLGSYGYSRNTSPFIDKLAAEGVLFEQAYSNSSYTRESVSSFMMGLYPSRTPWSGGWEAFPDPDITTLPEFFKKNGYHTAFFSNTLMLNHPDFYKRFDTYQCFMDSAGLSGLGPKLSERAASFIEENKNENTFTYLHYFDPHSPYEPPDEWYTRFADEVYPNRLTLRDHIRDNFVDLVKAGFGPGNPDFEDFMLRYDAEIAYEDHSLGALFDQLKGMGALDNAVIVFTSDHGEEFLDHGFLEHAWRLYPESIHVPLIFWSPKRFKPMRITERVELTALLPTLLKIAQIEFPKARECDGLPLFEFSQGQWVSKPYDKPITSELLVGMRNVVRSVIDDNLQYIAAPKYMSPAEMSGVWNNSNDVRYEYLAGKRVAPDLWGPLQYEALFDLSVDPTAMNNIIADHTDIRDARRLLLDNYHDQCPTQIPDPAKAARSPNTITPEMRETLRSLGYLDSKVTPQDSPEEESGPSPEETEEILRGIGYL